jgi:cold shock protein
MARGTVKWFDSKKGCGVIEIDAGKEIFVHHNAIQGHRFESLNAGDRVEFEIRQDIKGEPDLAENVVKISIGD